MDFILNISQVVLGVIVAYFIIRRFTGSKDKVFISKFFKYFIALFVSAVAFSAIGKLLLAEPELVTQAVVEQLQANPDIKRAIGKQQGYGYNKDEIKEIKKYPATINFSLYGSKADMKLSLVVDSSLNIFEVKDFKVEKLTEK